MNYVSLQSQDRSPLSRDNLPPALVIGTSVSACERGKLEIELAGLRLADAVRVEDGIDRLDRQAKASALWVEIDRDEGARLDRLLERVDRDAVAGSYGVVVSTVEQLVDPVVSRISSANIDVLVDATAAERVGALALACADAANRSGVADVASDASAARLRKLSDEVGRIAASLARLSTGPEQALTTAPPALAAKSVSPLTSEQVGAVIRARRARSRFFASDLFADPAWDMLLDLTQAEITHVRVPVSSLCIAAAVPATTALRWIKTLTDNAVLTRRADPHDGRRVFVEMAPATSRAMHHYFSEVGAIVGA